jgi:hypothetical protein
MDTKLAVIQREPNALMVGAEHNALGVVEQINKLTLLTVADAKNLAAAQSFILSTYTDVPEYRPLVIKLSSVLNDGQFPTPDSKFWQCKKEAEVHFNQMVSEIYKYERGMVDIEEMDYVIASSERKIESDTIDIDPIKLGFEIKRLKIKRDEYIFNMKIVEKSIKYRIQEVVEWAAISDSLKNACKYDTKDYNAHIAENLYKKLEIDINSSQDDGAKRNYSAQLATLKRLLLEFGINQKQ